MLPPHKLVTRLYSGRARKNVISRSYGTMFSLSQVSNKCAQSRAITLGDNGLLALISDSNPTIYDLRPFDRRIQCLSMDLRGFTACKSSIRFITHPCLDVGFPVAGLEVEVECEALGTLELGQPDVAGRAGLVAPHHPPAVALGRHPKVLRVRPERDRG